MPDSSLFPASHSDVVLSVFEMPTSLNPISLAELYLYCYLSNLLALKKCIPLSEWGYRLAIAAQGFLHAEALDLTIIKLRRKHIVDMAAGNISRLDPRFSKEVGLLD